VLYVYGGILVDPAHKAAVTAAAAAFARECRAEEGCIEYNLAWDAGNEDYLRLLEVWEPTATHAQHVAQPHVLAWTEFIQSAAAAAPDFTRFTVDVVGE
jgi:quinol monooxygenase YgiN